MAGRLRGKWREDSRWETAGRLVVGNGGKICGVIWREDLVASYLVSTYYLSYRPVVSTPTSHACMDQREATGHRRPPEQRNIMHRLPNLPNDVLLSNGQ